MWSERRGVTFVEAMVVAALASGILAAFYFFFLTMKGRDESLSREQEFQQLAARLSLALRLDLRTAVEVAAEGENRFVIRRLVPDGEGAERETVVWSHAPDRRTVIREGRSRTVYDYSGLLPPGKGVVFKIR